MRPCIGDERRTFFASGAQEAIFETDGGAPSGEYPVICTWYLVRIALDFFVRVYKYQVCKTVRWIGHRAKKLTRILKRHLWVGY